MRFASVEEAYLLATYIREIDPTAVLALGPVPIIALPELNSSVFAPSATDFATPAEAARDAHRHRLSRAGNRRINRNQCQLALVYRRMWR